VHARASVGRAAANASRYPPFNPVGEAGARTDGAPVTLACASTFRCDAPARCDASADERRIVAGGEGGRVRTRKAHPARSGVRLRRDATRFGGRAVASGSAPPFTPACSSPPSGALRPHAAARSPMSGASGWAAWAAHKAQAAKSGSQVLGGGFGVHASTVEWPLTRQGSRRSKLLS